MILNGFLKFLFFPDVKIKMHFIFSLLYDFMSLARLASSVQSFKAIS